MSWLPNRLRVTVWYTSAIVRLAACLVPPRQRLAWRVEQQRRFWHWCHFLAESGQLDPQNRMLIARSCWRLLPEAFWLRYDREQFIFRTRRWIGSPRGLLAALSTLTLLLVVASGIVSAFRLAFSAPLTLADQVVVITLDGKGINGKFSRTRSDTLFDLASVWSKTQLADGLTAFSWGPSTLLLPIRDLPVSAARVGPDFFRTLGVKAFLGRTFTPADVQNCPSCLAVLSYSLWQHEYHADPDIVGKTVILNGNHRTVIGVLPQSFRLISPGIAVWGLLDPEILFTNFQRRVGAVARLRPDVTPARLQGQLSDLTESAGYVHPSSLIQVMSVTALVRRNLYTTLSFVLLGIGCAVLVVALRRTSNGFGPLPEETRANVRWFAFFAVKSALVLALSAIASWWFVHSAATLIGGSMYPTADEYSIWLFLPVAILALSWSVADQRGRCRVCLRRLELPVEIGRTGSVLLNWSGTEMVCPDGHGVLYLPDSPENALDQDRWNRLDDSWQNLFDDGK